MEKQRQLAAQIKVLKESHRLESAKKLADKRAQMIHGMDLINSVLCVSCLRLQLLYKLSLIVQCPLMVSKIFSQIF